MIENIIFVKNFITQCQIGIYAKEKKKKQKIKISVKLFINKKINKDNISDTVSYENILENLKQVKNYNHINLVETLAYKLASKFENIKYVKKIKIKIVKCRIANKDTDVGFILIKSL
ncbi:MAG: hypothetical protein CMP40_03365 [Rickettsiales bacterium]|nr:hypothetical protein [Rickettsiales bacterium]|tara:strand:+ start:344 stop:694 length:351 start_codon:yes stop_codon:yes gene_type:complete